jgi:hypothetical protein
MIMKRIILVLGIGLLIFQSYAQPAGLTGEIWYLRYILIDGEQQFAPLGESLDLSFFEDNGNLIAQANGIENSFEAETAFTSSTLSFIDHAITLGGCSLPNCPYEDLYFYGILTNSNLEDKTFEFDYNEYSSGVKDLWIRDDDNDRAYYTNEPIEPNPALFQTWYLIESGVDFGDSQIYTGPDVPRITIASDFTFTGVNMTTNFEGNFTYGEDSVNDFKLVLENLSDPNTGIPDLMQFLPLTCSVATEFLMMESYPGFYSAFRNTVTLSTPEYSEQINIIYPSPVQDKLFINSVGSNFHSVSIMDVNGRLIIVDSGINLNEMDVSGLKAGMYFVKMEAFNGSSVIKFIKK